MMQKALIFLFLFFFTAESKDLGVFGETFEISEKDLLERIFSRLKVLQETGKLELEQKKVTERVRKMILHPHPIECITHAQQTREYKFDPTITITRDLSGHREQVFAKKGDRFNPLDRISFSKPLLFIDGDENTHIKWANAKISDNNLSKIILVKGSPLDLEKRLDREIFFDQHGILTIKLGIKNVPAIVFQKAGEKILTIIEEVVVPEEK